MDFDDIFQHNWLVWELADLELISYGYDLLAVEV